jgi:hypothetical protein
MDAMLCDFGAFQLFSVYLGAQVARDIIFLCHVQFLMRSNGQKHFPVCLFLGYYVPNTVEPIFYVCSLIFVVFTCLLENKSREESYVLLAELST